MRSKNNIFAVASLFLFCIGTLFFANVFAFIFMYHTYGVNTLKNSSYSEYAKKRLFLTKDHLPSIVHPFLGRLAFSEFTIVSNLSDEPLFFHIDKSNSEDDIKVLIVGGSVAANTSESESVGPFARILNEYFHTDKFSVYNAAFGGGKEPEQYFKILYLDLLGFKPDIILNIDGFNEIAVTLYENFNLRNPAIYPRSFSARVESNSNSVRACIKSSDRLVGMGTYMPLIAFVGDIYYQRCKASIEIPQLPWWRDLSKPTAFDDYVKQSQAIWEQSSRKIGEFSRNHEIDYIHVLQPNQYFPDSKPYSDKELREALDLPSYGELIKKYYSLLSAKGVPNENFYDQRMLFKDEERTVYNDNCCHFNNLGNELLISDIISHFRPVFEKRLISKRQQ